MHGWIKKCAALLRAARCVWERVGLDYAALTRFFQQGKVTPNAPRPPPRAYVVDQAMALVVAALENALKACIVAKHGYKDTGGRLPKELRHHRIAELAACGDVAPADDDERDALTFGEEIFSWVGRYPAPLSAKEYPTDRSINPSRAWHAYLRLITRAVETAARMEYARGMRGPNGEESEFAFVARQRDYFEDEAAL